jgi:hypothetical protein
VKKENIQTHRRQFESLKMKDEENVAAYLLGLDEIFNIIKGIGEDSKEPITVKRC